MRDTRFYLGASCLVALSYFLGLESIGLFEAEETRYAQIAREMAASGDWIVPRIEGFPYLEKPPLTNWLTALSFLAFGESEGSARLPSLLGALLTLGFTWRIGRFLGGDRAGKLAVAILAVSPLFFGMARILSTDMIFTAGTTAAIDCYLRSCASSSRWLRLGLGLSLASAFLAKGPLILALLGFAALSCAISLRSLSAWRPFFHPLVWGSFLVIGMPWFLAVSDRYPDFWDFFFYRHHFERFLGLRPLDRDLHAESLEYFVPVLLGGFLPWSFWLPAAFRGAWRSWDVDRRVSLRRALWIWAAFVFLFFSIGLGKRIPYVLPIWPALAAGTAFYWARREQGEPGWVRRPLALPAAMFSMAVLFCGAVAFLEKKEARFSLELIAGKIEQIVPPGETLILFPRFLPGASYYGRRPIEVMGSLHEIEAGQEFEPERPAPSMTEAEFSKRMQTPGRFVLLGTQGNTRRHLSRWDPEGKLRVVAENERWILLAN